MVQYRTGANGAPVKGAVCVIGSTNWTDSSTANLEFSAVLRELNAEFIEDWSTEFSRGWSRGRELSDAVAEADREGYGRRSASRSGSRSLARDA